MKEVERLKIVNFSASDANGHIAKPTPPAEQLKPSSYYNDTTLRGLVMIYFDVVPDNYTNFYLETNKSSILDDADAWDIDGKGRMRG